jgi:serine/threonine-protein kinase
MPEATDSYRSRIPPGTRLNGIYEIERLIGYGGMGEVYKGHTIQTGDPVAIKVMLPELAENAAAMALFRKEASALHTLQHDAIVRYYVFTVEPVLQRPYLAMEFVEGQALSERLKEGALGFEAVEALRRRLAAGLQAAHERGIVHRDISPDNVIIPGGDVGRAKIIDFGIARSSLGRDGTVIGSGFAGKFNYVSPEQLGLFGGNVTGKSDIYSLGLLLVEALTGRALDMGGSQVEVIEKRRKVPDLGGIDVRIRPLIERMLQPNPDDRPESMAQVAAWQPSAAHPYGGRFEPARSRAPAQPSQRAGNTARRVAALVLAVALFGAGAAYYAYFGLAWPPGAPPSTETPLVAAAPPPLAPAQREPVRPAAPEAPPLRPAPAVAPAPLPPAAAPVLTPSAPAETVVPLGAAPALRPVAPEAPEAPALAPAQQARPEAPAPASPGTGARPAPPLAAPPLGAQPSRPPAARPTTPPAPPALQPAQPEPKVALLPPAAKPETAVPRTDQIIRFINDYHGGECIHVTPVRVTATTAEIEGLGAAVAPFHVLDREFKRTIGFEPDIGVRQVTEAQCPAVTFLGALRANRALAPRITANTALLKSGEVLIGTVDNYGDRHLELLLVTDEGVVHNITRFLRPSTEGRSFHLRLERSGEPGPKPQLLLAVTSVRPLPGLEPGAEAQARDYFARVLAEATRTGQSLGAAVTYFRLDL